MGRIIPIDELHHFSRWLLHMLKPPTSHGEFSPFSPGPWMVEELNFCALRLG
jgi:hypothetical protein